MIRILTLSFALLFSTVMSAYAGFTSPANGISTTGNYTVSWQGNPMDYGVEAYANYGTPIYRLTEQKLNSGIPPQLVTLQSWTSSSVSILNKPSGQYIYTYSERHCTVSGCSYYTPPDGQIIVSVGSDAVYVEPPLEPATAVGSTAYSADTDQKGNAVINIPISLPAGIGGMQPQLSLSFNSGGVSDVAYRQAATGWLGFGWSMNGISTISRCTTGKLNEIVTMPNAGSQPLRPQLKYDDTDYLCLDGEKLVLISGTHLRVGAVYRTIKESFRLITIMGTDATPWFEIRNPNGSVAVFGKNTNSRIQKVTISGGSVKTPYFTWAIDSETDKFNNKIIYSYSFKDEAYSYQANKQRIYPDFIQYPGGSVKFNYRWVNEATSVNPLNYYPSEPVDKFRFFNDGAHQLSSIKIRNSDVGDDRIYTIYGSGQTNQQVKDNGLRVGSIQECARVDGAQNYSCLKPLSFGWDTGSYTTIYGNYQELKSITDGLGTVTEFTYDNKQNYAAISDNPTARPRKLEQYAGLPFALPTGNLTLGKSGAMRVVKEMRKSTGLVSGNYRQTQYEYYADGIEDPYGMGFLGYEAVKLTDVLTGTTVYRQYYRPNVNAEGVLTLAAEHSYSGIYGQAGVQLLSKAEYRRNFKSLSFTNGSVTTTTFVPTLEQSTSFTYENGTFTGATIKTNDYQLNTTNNVFTKIVSTVVSGNQLNALTFTPTLWGENAAHTLVNSSVTGTQILTTDLDSSTSNTDWRIGYTTKIKSDSYDTVIGSDVKSQETTYKVKTGTTLVETENRFPGDSEKWLTTTNVYDIKGRKSSVTVQGANVASRTTTYSDYRMTVPGKVTNPLLHESSVSDFDDRFELPRRSVDINGIMTTREYDAYGRVIMSMDANGVITTSVFTACSTTYCATVTGKLGDVTPVYFNEVQSVITPTSRKYYDALGRVIRSEVEGFLAGEWYRTDVQYDEAGRVYKTSIPYKLGATIYWNTNYYDNRSRLIQTIKADGGVIDTQYTTEVVGSYSQLVIAVTETIKKADGTVADTVTKRSYFNNDGQLAKTIDAYNTTKAVTTTYEYDALGNVVKTIVDGGTDGSTQSTAVFDDAGNRTSLTDPNAGTVTSKYTALGQLREATDAKGTVTTYQYDLLGRMTSSSNNIDGVSSWVYDPVGGKGLLSYSEKSGYKQTYFYQDPNRAARLSRVETAVNVAGVPGSPNKTFTESFTYDFYGRSKKITSPSGYALSTKYNAQGYVYATDRGDNWYGVGSITKMGPFGVEEEYLNGSTITTRSYDPKSGRPNSILTTYYNYSKIQDLNYKWHTNGSLQTRTDNKSGTPIVDTFGYDAHDRLTTTATSVNNVAQRTLTQGYNNLGNLNVNTSSNGADAQVSGYQYGTNPATLATKAGPHAVSQASIKGISNTLYYDQNGAITQYDAVSGSDKFIAYNSANQPTKITVGSSMDDANPIARDEFKYSPDGARYYKKSTYLANGIQRVEHTFYAGSYETTFYDTNSSIYQTEKTTYGNFLYIRKTPYVGTVVETQQVLHRDHLGSVDTVTAGMMSNVATMAFEPFGSRRNSATLTSNITTPQLSDLFTKIDSLPSAGYTGHESLDRTGFIHMNGRVYDPQLARFLSPDPLVQAPTNSQSWNRYSYVFNNPLKYVDPSGYATEEVVVTCDAQCQEKFTREGNAAWLNQNLQSINDQNGRWNGMLYDGGNMVGFEGKVYDISNAKQLAALVKAGGGSKTNLNNITLALEAAGWIEVVTAYVGGAGDIRSGLVKGIHEKYGKENDKYFEWTDGKKLAAWIDDNQGKHIRVIGHSYGGDTAAGVVAKGHHVNELITVDPVGWIRPNFSNVAKYSDKWTNYNSSGTGFTINNAIATVGRAYNNSPQGYADYHYNAPLEHAAICSQYCAQ